VCACVCGVYVFVCVCLCACLFLCVSVYVSVRISEQAMVCERLLVWAMLCVCTGRYVQMLLVERLEVSTTQIFTHATQAIASRQTPTGCILQPKSRAPLRPCLEF